MSIEKSYKVILTAMLKGTCVPTQQELHFIKAINKKGVLREAKDLVKKKGRHDSCYGWWHIDAVYASNGKIIYPYKRKNLSKTSIKRG